MKKIQIFGTGCSKCNTLAENTETALRKVGLDIPVEKVTNLPEILDAGIMMTPALVIGGEVKAVGKVLSPAEILDVLQSAGVSRDSSEEDPSVPGPDPEPARSGAKGTRIAIVVGLILALGMTLWVKNQAVETAVRKEPRETRAMAPVDPSQPIVQDEEDTVEAAVVPRASGKKVAAAKPTHPLPRLLDLGRGTCVPCKMMMPVLEELKKSFAGRLDVEYIDISKKPEAAKRWEVRMIPTQIFIDEEGNELTRHTGFFPRDDILAEWKRIGYDFDSAETVELFEPVKNKQQD